VVDQHLPAGGADFAVLVAAIRAALKDVPPRNGYSVADLCSRWRIGADKVNGFIRRLGDHEKSDGWGDLPQPSRRPQP
jgi:hypothetical protein